MCGDLLKPHLKDLSCTPQPSAQWLFIVSLVIKNYYALVSESLQYRHNKIKKPYSLKFNIHKFHLFLSVIKVMVAIIESIVTLMQIGH